MDIYVIPFKEKFIIYRPLIGLAFLGNNAMVYYIKDKLAGKKDSINNEVEQFLESINFCKPDPPLPQSWIPSDKHYPTIAVLLMTGDCNLRCTYCYARGGESPDLQMSFPLAKKIIDTVCKNAYNCGKGYFSLVFHGGGEPTMNWEVMIDTVEYAKRKDLPCYISMSTNGIWSLQQRKFILRHFKDLTISFDGIRKVQNTQRPLFNGGSSFEIVMETIKALDRAHFPYGIRVTTTLNSFKHLPENITFLCKKTKCKGIQVEPCYTDRRGDYSDPTGEQGKAFTDAFLKAFEISSNFNRSLTYSGARPWMITTSFCRALEDALIVTPEGDIVTCFETCDKHHPLISKFIIGKATTSEIIIDMNRIRNFVEKQQKERVICEDCFCYWHCGGDCTVKSISYEHNRRRCIVNRDIIRELLAWYIVKGNGVWKKTHSCYLLKK